MGKKSRRGIMGKKEGSGEKIMWLHKMKFRSGTNITFYMRLLCEAGGWREHIGIINMVNWWKN